MDSFEVGQHIECLYVAPDKGRVTINLLTESGDTALHHDIRYDISVHMHSLVLNTRINGIWGTEEHPGGFDFTDGILVTVKIVAAETGFQIYCNGKYITTYDYRSGLTSLLVEKVTWKFQDDGASVEPQLKSFSIGYD